MLVLSIFRFAETNRLSERYRGEYRENGLSLSFSWKAVSRIFPTKSSFHSCPSCHVPLAMNAVWGKTRKEFCVIIVARLSFPAHVEFVWLRFCTLFPGLFFYFHCFVHFFFSIHYCSDVKSLGFFYVLGFINKPYPWTGRFKLQYWVLFVMLVVCLLAWLTAIFDWRLEQVLGG